MIRDFFDKVSIRNHVIGRLTGRGPEHGANVIAPERVWEAGSQPTANLCRKKLQRNPRNQRSTKGF